MIFIFSQTFLLGKVKDYIYKDVLNDPTLYIFRADAMLGTGDASQITNQAARDKKRQEGEDDALPSSSSSPIPSPAEGRGTCRMSDVHVCVCVFKMHAYISHEADRIFTCDATQEATGDGRREQAQCL